MRGWGLGFGVWGLGLEREERLFWIDQSREMLYTEILYHRRFRIDSEDTVSEFRRFSDINQLVNIDGVDWSIVEHVYPRRCCIVLALEKQSLERECASQ